MPCIAVGCDGDFDEGPSAAVVHEEPCGAAAETVAAALSSKSASSTCMFSGDTSSAPWHAGSHGVDPEEDEEEEEDEEAGETAAPGTARWSLSIGGDEEPAEALPPAPRSFIILDIDGVLNTRSDPRLLSVEEAPCARLRQLLDASGAELVLSTPWRRHHQYVLEVLVKFGVFKEGEAPQELKRTPSHASEGRRDLEILQWLGAHRAEVGSWAVLDAGDLLQRPSAARLQGHVVRPAPGEGLTAAVAEEVLRVLGVSGGLSAARAPAGESSSKAEAAALSSTAILDNSFGGVSISVTSIAAAGGAASSTAAGAPRFANAGVTTQAPDLPGAADFDNSFGGVSVSFTSVAAPVARASTGAGAPRFASAGVSTQADSGGAPGPRFANAGVSTQAAPAAAAPTPAEASGLSAAFRGIGAWDDALEAKMRDLLGALAPSTEGAAGAAGTAGAARAGGGASGDGGGEFDDLFVQARGQFSAK